MDDQLYREHLLDIYHNPLNYGNVEDAVISYHGQNPLCGDEIAITAAVKDNRISAIKFAGKGCAISQASASLLTEEAKGKTLGGVESMEREQMQKLLGVQVSVSRVKCMMLALVTLKKGIMQYRGNADGTA